MALIERRTANLAKTNIEVSFKKYALNLRKYMYNSKIILRCTLQTEIFLKKYC